MGHELSFATTNTFAGEKAGSGVQHNLPITGLEPIKVNVEPGSSAAAFAVRTMEEPTSASVNGISTQNGTPLQTSTDPALTMNAFVPLVRPVLTGGVVAQFCTMNMKSRITVPMGTPMALYVVTSIATT